MRSLPRPLSVWSARSRVCSGSRRCGLTVCSTDVGGVPEVLPHECVVLGKPGEVTCEADWRVGLPLIRTCRPRQHALGCSTGAGQGVSPGCGRVGLASRATAMAGVAGHGLTARAVRRCKQVYEAYGWDMVARKTEDVYTSATQRGALDFASLLWLHARSGSPVALLSCCLLAAVRVILAVLELVHPTSSIDKAPALPCMPVRRSYPAAASSEDRAWGQIVRSARQDSAGCNQVC